MGSKTKTVYVCSNCGADSPKWIGRCPNCGEWNTYVEEVVAAKPVKTPLGKNSTEKAAPVKITDIQSEQEVRN